MKNFKTNSFEYFIDYQNCFLLEPV